MKKNPHRIKPKKSYLSQSVFPLGMERSYLPTKGGEKTPFLKQFGAKM